MIRFLVFSDLHYDDFADVDKRVEEIVTRAKSKQLDFIVSLGDICDPILKNCQVLKKFNSLGIPFYHVIGNHETDGFTLNEIAAFFSMPASYYSVKWNDYKLIFLNTNYLEDNEGEKAFYKKNFQEIPSKQPLLPADEMEWLQQELSDGMKYIVFSHHSLTNELPNRGVANREKVYEMFRGKEVLLCMNGHDHGDSYTCIDGTSYITVNSANYAWLGTQIDSSEALREKYSYLNGKLQYGQAMSAYIEIDEKEIRIDGAEGSYLSVTPDDIELYDYRFNGVSVKPRISSRRINLVSGTEVL